MLLNKVVLEGTDILLVIFAIYLFSCYFDIFFTRRKKRILAGIGYMVFVIWQFVLSSVSILPVYINISIGNLLENAVEAAEKVRENKYIKIKMKYDKSNLLIFLINSYQGQLIKMKDKSLKSTKSDVGNHGVGLPSVYRAVAKYHGTVTIDDSIPEQFGIRVVLYGSEE